MEALERLPGTPLPEGRFTIDADEDRRLTDALGAVPAGNGTAHPAWAYIATQRGIGIELADLFRLADFDISDGPLLGSCELVFTRPIHVEHPYRVTGQIVGIERKRGRRAGVFDVLTVREELHDQEAPVAAATNVFVLPRREAR